MPNTEDVTPHTPDSIVSFYLNSAWPERAPHNKFMAPERMKQIFLQLLPDLKNGTNATKVRQLIGTL